MRPTSRPSPGKTGFAPESSDAARWREEGTSAQQQLRTAEAGASANDWHLDALWNGAIEGAQRDAIIAAEESVKPRQRRRPHGRDFDFDAAARRIRISTATG